MPSRAPAAPGCGDVVQSRCDARQQPACREQLFAEVFNVTNRANFATPTGDRASANFLRVTGLSTSTNPRLVQLGVRYSF